MDVPGHVRDELPRVVRFDPKGIRNAVHEVEAIGAVRSFGRARRKGVRRHRDDP